MGRNAVILVDKGEGITSFDCLGRIKRNVNKKTGHCGTLDKFAHGLMIVLCGSYTHMVPAFMGLDKTYEAEIEFGRMTDTLDPEGEVVETSPVPSEEVILSAVRRLTGVQMQLPPVYSAIHVNGKRSYQMARSGASEVDLTPRLINIYSAEVLSWKSPVLTIRLHVSKGTYIRSFARDLGHMCFSSAFVRTLYRTQIGPFRVEDAVRYDDEDALKLIPEGRELISMLPGSREIEINDIEAFKAANGYVKHSVRERIAEGTTFAILMHDGEPVCVYSLNDNKIICQVHK
ncbi:MAG: tRNA pseudouridine(55) synthase TruB [Spirochaetales bacterium]|nr:tRNA pseudouridine(55) synthase TruB [Spirochaetales bacterium]MBQ9810890.1 tRNA pseudouridine(55) synthase TruB [Spirochaetales bacterium]